VEYRVSSYRVLVLKDKVSVCVKILLDLLVRNVCINSIHLKDVGWGCDGEGTSCEWGWEYIMWLMVRVETRRSIPKAHSLSDGEGRNMHIDRGCSIWVLVLHYCSLVLSSRRLWSLCGLRMSFEYLGNQIHFLSWRWGSVRVSVKVKSDIKVKSMRLPRVSWNLKNT
jgi:hypothetical protein